MVQTREPSESIEYYVLLSPPPRLAPRADHDDKRTAERRNITDVNVEEEFLSSNKFQENHLLPVLGTPSDLSRGSIRQKIDEKEEQQAITYHFY